MKKSKIRVAIVSMKTVAENGGRLDPEYYLGTNDDRELEMAKYRLRPAVFRRYFTAIYRVIKNRLRYFWFRSSGRVK